MIDAFISPDAALDLRQDAQKLTGRDPDVILNMDSHRDHTRGNQAFREQAIIISTQFTRDFVKSDFEHGFSREKESTEAAISAIEAEWSKGDTAGRAESNMMHSFYTAILE